MSYDYSIACIRKAGSKVRGCRGMFYSESSSFTVTGFNLTGEIYKCEGQRNKEKNLQQKLNSKN